MTLKITQNDIGKTIYILGRKGNHKLNNNNAILYINNEISKFKNYIIPKTDRIYYIKI